MLAVRQQMIPLRLAGVVGHNRGGGGFEVFVVGRKENASLAVGKANFKVLVFVLDCGLFDQLIFCHDLKIPNRELIGDKVINDSADQISLKKLIPHLQRHRVGARQALA